MSSWNYRVMRHKSRDRTWLAIHEVYYRDKPDEWPYGPTVEPVPVVDDDIEGLRWTLERMLEALEKPILDYDYEGDGRHGEQAQKTE